jgi:YVTN family beta-propeller protein
MRIGHAFRSTIALLVFPALAAAAPLAYVAHGGSRYVTVIDTDTLEVVRRIDVGLGPEAVAIAPNGAAVYVASKGTGAISVIDPAFGIVVDSRVLGYDAVGPRAIVVSPDSGRLYGLQGGTVVPVDLAGPNEGAIVGLDPDATGIALLPDGSRWYATGTGNGTVVAFDVGSYALRVLHGFARPTGIVASPDGKRVYVADAGKATVTVIDTATDRLTGSVPVDAGPHALAISPDGRKLYATSTLDTVSVVDTASLAKVASWPVGRDPRGVAVTPDGTLVMVTNRGDDTVTFIAAPDGVSSTLRLADGPASFGAFIAPDTAVAAAIEYVHTGFGHYFVTADPVEIHALDTGAFGNAWARTGFAFKVWSAPNPSTVPVCRYYSAAFERSTHVYSPYRDECAMLAAHPAWQAESYAFDVQLPLHAGAGHGSCPPGTTILFRLFNNFEGGAPNHRYTDDPILADRMVAERGWTREGESVTGAFACVPR